MSLRRSVWEPVCHRLSSGESVYAETTTTVCHSCGETKRLLSSTPPSSPPTSTTSTTILLVSTAVPSFMRVKNYNQLKTLTIVRLTFKQIRFEQSKSLKYKPFPVWPGWPKTSFSIRLHLSVITLIISFADSVACSRRTFFFTLIEMFTKQRRTTSE